METLKLSRIENIPTPSFISNELLGIQPMSSRASSIFKIKYVTCDIAPPKQGEKKHSFIYGYQVFYGTQWISPALYLKIKIAGL